MQNETATNPYLIQLIKSAYALADALSATHEIKEIYSQKKDMTFEEWGAATHHLVSKMDQIILKECGFLVFKVSLHNYIDRTENLSLSKGSLEAVSPQIYSAALHFGSAMRQVFDNFQPIADPDRSPSVDESNRMMARTNEIIDLCQQMVNLILNDLGIKSTDLARIY